MIYNGNHAKVKLEETSSEKVVRLWSLNGIIIGTAFVIAAIGTKAFSSMMDLSWNLIGRSPDTGILTNTLFFVFLVVGMLLATYRVGIVKRKANSSLYLKMQILFLIRWKHELGKIQELTAEIVPTNVNALLDSQANVNIFLKFKAKNDYLNFLDFWEFAQGDAHLLLRHLGFDQKNIQIADAKDQPNQQYILRNINEMALPTFLSQYSTKAIASLLLCFASIFLLPLAIILAPAALVVGILAFKETGQGKKEGRLLAIFSIVFAVILIAFLAAAGVFLSYLFMLVQ